MERIPGLAARMGRGGWEMRAGVEGAEGGGGGGVVGNVGGK